VIGRQKKRGVPRQFLRRKGGSSLPTRKSLYPLSRSLERGGEGKWVHRNVLLPLVGSVAVPSKKGTEVCPWGERGRGDEGATEQALTVREGGG